MSSDTKVEPDVAPASQLVDNSTEVGRHVDPSLQLPRQQAEGTQSGLYGALDSAQDEIRVLVIHPADDPMAVPHCTMEIVSLYKAPRYLALSYEWGDPQGEELRSWEGRKAFVNGKEKTITPNLHAALIYLRLRIFSTSEPGPDTRFWIDAVCINQEDDVERTQQVALMEKIYSMALYVVLWLGVDRDNSSLAVALIEEAASGPRHQDAKASSDWYIQRLNDPHYKEHWIAFCQLLQRSFWRRSWIIQEIILARTAVLICGNDAVMLKPLFTVAADLVRLQGSLGSSQGPVLLPKILMLMINFHRIRQCREDYENDLEPKRGLLYHLESLSWTRASDPRDKVYSLLGIAKPYNGVRLSVNYTISSSQIFIDTAAYIIKGTRSFDILAMAGFRTQNLPSWVPDWSDQDWTDPLISGMNTAVIENVDRSGRFSSGGATYSSAAFSDNNRVLMTGAILVSVVEQLISTKPHPYLEQYSFSEVAAELINIIAFLSSEYRQAALGEMQTEVSEQMDNRPDHSIPDGAPAIDSQSLMRGFLAAVEVVLVLLYRALFWTSSYVTEAHIVWPFREFAKFCKDCLRRTATPASCTGHQLAMLGTALSNGGVGRRFFKCSLPEEFDRTPELEAAFTSDQRAALRADLDAIFSRASTLQAFGHGRGLIEVGDIIAIIPGCRSPLILRRPNQGHGRDCYRLIGAAYCYQLMNWASLPKLPVQNISLR